MYRIWPLSCANATLGFLRGTTLYELCAVGVPSVSFTTADNQLSAVKTFSDVQIIPYAGDACSSLDATCDA